MLQFLNDDTIEDNETGITVQIYTNPIPLQDYYPYEDFFKKTEYHGDEIVAVWLNHNEALDSKADIIVQNALDYFIAF